MKYLLVLSAILAITLQESGPWRLVFEQDKKLASVREDGSAWRDEGAAESKTSVPSPDGRLQAFIRKHDLANAWAIWVAGVDGSGPRPVTGYWTCPIDSLAWTPDGRQIVFEMKVPGKGWEIRSADIDPSDHRVHILACGPAGARAPRISPRGDCFSYLELHESREKLPPCTLRLASMKGGHDAKVVLANVPILDHAWSPSGDRLAVSLVQELRILEMPSGKVVKSFDYAAVHRNLYSHGASGLTWKPDGKAIACSIRFLGGRLVGAKLMGDNEIFILPLEGKPVIVEAGGPAVPVRWAR